MKEKHWWQNQPLTISAIQSVPSQGSDKAFDDYVSKSGYNVEQLLHLFIDEADMVYVDEQKYGKKLDEYLAKAKKHGIKEIVYTNSHGLNKETGKAHPEYWQLGKDGKPLLIYGIYNLACINPKGAFHKKLMQDVEALCKHDINGIFFDGPIMRDTGCYCEICKADFLNKFGHSIYEATPQELHQQRVDSVTEHVKQLHDLIKSINPEILLYINNSVLRPDVIGSNARKLNDYVDMLGAEAGFYYPRKEIDAQWQTAGYMKHLECVIGDPVKTQKPIVNFVASNDASVSCQMKTVGETALTYAQTLANGANVWYGFHDDLFDTKDTPAAEKAREYNEFILANKEYYKASKTCARVALMWSDSTANNYSTSVAASDFTNATEGDISHTGDHRISVFGFIDMLARNHVQFDIVDEKAIEDGALTKYDVLILPTVACMAQKHADIITKFVEDGGNLLGNFDVAMYNEVGEPCGESKLAKVFGIKGNPKVYNVTRWMSVMFRASNHPVLSSLDVYKNVSAFLDINWQYTDDVEVLMVAHPPRDSVYGDMPTERYPVYVEHKYGKGRAYYISGNICETTIDRSIPAYRKIIKGFCDYNARPVVRCDDLGLYEVVLRKQEDKFLLHIVNETGAMERPVEKVTPLYNISFKLDLSGFGIDKKDYKVKTLRGGKLENLYKNGNEISFRLDYLNEYEVVVFYVKY